MGYEHWTVEDIGDLTGKVAVVTGANIGLGLEITKQLALKGCEVVMACRNETKAEKAKEEILPLVGANAKIVIMKVDVSSLASVKDFAAEFKKKYTTLDLLMLNAGVMALDPRQESVDGFEMQLATNHLGQFVLTGELLPLLKATPHSRVVTQSSGGNWTGSFNWDDLNATKKYARYEQYGMTKLANITFMNELQKRLTAANLSSPTAYSVHPGIVVGQLQVNATSNFFERMIYGLVPLFANDYHLGSVPSLFCLTSPNAKPGKLYGPSGPFFVHLFTGKYPQERDPNKLAMDPETGKRLWEASEELTGYTFDVTK